MKKIYSLLISALLVTGCTLDREPETSLADNNFWTSETFLRGACNRLYIDLPGFSHDKRSDELVGPNQDGISSGNRSVPGTSGDWTDPYDKIGVCNNIIIKAEASTSFSQAVKDRWTAEARFFRAYHYFDLVKKYGDVPLILKAFDNTTDPDIVKGRDPRETVIQQCYTDLEFAVEHLPAIEETKNDWGRVSQSAALGMLVRIGLYEGTHKKYHQTPGGDYKAHLEKAIKAAERMIYTEKKHDLYPDFERLFTFDGEGASNKESVFVKIYGPNGNAGVVTHNNVRGLENTAALTRSMLDNFLYIDGLPREKTSHRIAPETQFSDIVANRDPRLTMTLFTPGEDAFKGPYKPFKTDDQTHGYGYAIKKGWVKSEWSLNSKGTLDKMIIRYAEILLSYAEAWYEYNGSIDDGKLGETVNKVRGRVGFNVDLTNTFVQANGLDMLQEIRRERMVEFIDESLHYDDIIRWKTAEEVLPKAVLGLLYNYEDTGGSVPEKVVKDRLTDADGNYKGQKVYDEGNIYVIEEAGSRNFNPERDYLYPIPSYEIGTSGGKIKQNPHWGNEEDKEEDKK